MWLSVSCALGATETVDGIKWWYTVSGGKASIGSGLYNGNKAIATSTSGAIAIPSSLGGYPVGGIGNYAFSDCGGLTSVTIPASVTNIGHHVFYGCSSLESFSVADENPTYKSVSSLLLTKDGKTLVAGVNGAVVIPDSVTSIGYNAFSGCSGLTSVTIPASVTNMGNSVFYGCCSLESFSVSDENPTYKSVSGFLLTKDGETLVAGVNGDVVIPDSVTSIGENAFYGCCGLTSVTIPSGVTNIGDSAFRDCSSLESFSVADENPIYKSVSGFLLTKDEKTLVAGVNGVVVIPDTVTCIGSNAFNGFSGLTSVVIPDSVTNIENYAFSGCSGLTSVTIPQCVCAWRLSAVFSGGGYRHITNIVIGASVTNTGGWAFCDCISLESFSVADGNPTYKAVSGLLLTKDGMSLVAGVNGDVVIPDSVTRIWHNAFYGRSNLTSVAISGSVTNIGSSAFYGCGGLTSVTIPDNVVSMGSDVFRECSGLTSVTIGNGLKSIGSDAFSSTYGYITSVFIHDLAAWCEISFETYYSNPLVVARHLYLDGEEVAGNLVIPDGTTSIANGAFYECSGLTNVTIPASVTSIGEDAFWNCSGLEGVTIGNGVTNIGDSAFYGCIGLTNLTIPDSVKCIGSGAFSECSGLTDMTIPDGVMSIREFAFSGCYGLTNVAIPDSVISIGDDAFGCCDALFDTDSIQGVCLLDGWVVGRSEWVSGDLDLTGIRGIADRVFSYCEGLESVTIPDGVSRIGSWTFEGCSGLTNVTIPSTVTSIGSNAFENCSSLTSVTIPASLTNIEGSAFYNCDGLTAVCIHDLAAWCGISFEGSNPLEYAGHLYLDGEEVVNLVIPDGVTSIGNDAFRFCIGLTSIAIGNGLKSIGDCAFLGCTNLTAVYIHDLAAWCGISFEGTDANPLYYARHLYLGGEEADNLVIPDGVTQIGSRVFVGCIGLTNVTIPNSVTNIGDRAFNSSGLTSVAIGNGVKSIGAYAFSACSGLTSMTIPPSVTSVGNNAFSGCSGLETLYVPASWEGSAKLAKAGVPSSCTIVYCKSAQSVTFDPIGPQTATGRVELGATAAGGGAVAFEVVSGPGVLEGNELVFTGSGTVVVRATAEGGVDWEAGEATREIVAVAEGAAAPIPASDYEAWVRETAGLDGGAAPQSARGANGRENWENYVCDIAPGSTNELEMAEVELDEQGRLVFRVGAASARRWYSLLVWDDLGEAPSEIDLGRGESGMTVTNGNLDDGGFTRLKVRLTE